jgi:predicted DCC family thiol-disulfide oxidoreductase YuxK
MTTPIVLFDGECNLCSGTVQFVLRRDRRARFRFASLQSPKGRELALGCGATGDCLDTLILIEEARCFARSSAALRVVRRLPWPWPLLYGFIVVPRPLRDLVYRWVARHRYRWFGRRSTCLMPTPEVQARFLE